MGATSWRFKSSYPHRIDPGGEPPGFRFFGQNDQPENSIIKRFGQVFHVEDPDDVFLRILRDERQRSRPGADRRLQNARVDALRADRDLPKNSESSTVK